MRCRQCEREMETYLAVHAELPVPRPAGLLRQHLDACPACARAFERALIGRGLLQSLRQDFAPSAVDGYFLTRLRARIAAAQAAPPSWLETLSPQRGLVLACAMFLMTLGTFAYNVHHNETPYIGEAIALDAPHVHVRHPSLDHNVQKVDVLLSVLSR